MCTCVLTKSSEIFQPSLLVFSICDGLTAWLACWGSCVGMA